MAKTGKNGHVTPQEEVEDVRLSEEQYAAIALLLTGRTDQEVADTIRRRRQTVNSWRLYHPQFQAELNRQRRHIWEGASDQLRGLLPEAVGVLKKAMGGAENGVRIALKIIEMASLPMFPSGETDADEIVRKAAQRQSDNERLDLFGGGSHMKQMRKALLAKAQASEDDPPEDAA